MSMQGLILCYCIPSKTVVVEDALAAAAKPEWQSEMAPLPPGTSFLLKTGQALTLYTRR
jgi:hypothetical protein